MKSNQVKYLANRVDQLLEYTWLGIKQKLRNVEIKKTIKL